MRCCSGPLLDVVAGQRLGAPDRARRRCGHHVGLPADPLGELADGEVVAHAHVEDAGVVGLPQGAELPRVAHCPVHDAAEALAQGGGAELERVGGEAAVDGFAELGVSRVELALTTPPSTTTTS